jgi:hypothetical protein
MDKYLIRKTVWKEARTEMEYKNVPARGNLTLLSGLNLLCQGMNGFMRFVVFLETVLGAKVSWRQTHLHTFGTCQSL